MEQFIEIVKQFPMLWNTESKDYHNLNKKDEVWTRIVEEISNPDIPDVKTAKNEWKKLRDSHRESLKRMKAGTNGQDASPTNNWKYAEILKFLLPHMRNRKRTGNVSTNYQNNLPGTSTDNQSTEIFVEIQDDESISEAPRQKKRKVGDESSIRDFLGDYMQRCRQRDKRRVQEAEEAKNNRHPLNLFFDSLCESTKKLPVWIQRDIKKEFLQIVCEAEENYETYLSGQQYQYSTPTEDE